MHLLTAPSTLASGRVSAPAYYGGQHESLNAKVRIQHSANRGARTSAGMRAAGREGTGLHCSSDSTRW